MDLRNMKSHYKAIALAFLIIILTIISVWGLNAYLDLARNPVEEYDYAIFQDGALFKAKNGKNGAIDFSSTNASSVITQAITHGNSLYLKFGEYELTSDLLFKNKKNAKIIGDGAILKCNGHMIVIRGNSYADSQYNNISWLEIINGTIRIENSFRTTVSNIVFRNSTVAIEVVNTETWTEGTKIEDSHFINSSESIVFRSPKGRSTGSYANTEINRCYFNLYSNNSIGIAVEPEAGFTDSLIQNIRIWVGEFGEENQTGLLVEGSMLQTLLENVVFESFFTSPINTYGVKLGQNAEPPILGQSVSFLGKWSARIHNPFNKWIFGSGGAFRKENVSIPIGTGNNYGAVQIIHAYPLRITSFKARMHVEGTFAHGETITLRFRLEFVDHSVSEDLEKSFNQSATLWLSDDDLFKLAPSENVIWACLVDAKTYPGSTNATVKIDLYGTTG